MIIQDKIYMDSLKVDKYLNIFYDTETEIYNIDCYKIDNLGMIGIKNFILSIEKLQS